MATSYTRINGKQGFPRNTQEFWQMWAQRHPETLSDTNLDFIMGVHPVTRKKLSGGFKAPIVDDQWIRYFPEHKQFKLDTLEHHHVDHGRWAIPLPMKLHRGNPFHQ